MTSCALRLPNVEAHATTSMILAWARDFGRCSPASPGGVTRWGCTPGRRLSRKNMRDGSSTDTRSRLLRLGLTLLNIEKKTERGLIATGQSRPVKVTRSAGSCDSAGEGVGLGLGCVCFRNWNAVGQKLLVFSWNESNANTKLSIFLKSSQCRTGEN